jgi:acyl carrier protein
MKPEMIEIAEFVRARVSHRTRVPAAEIADGTVLADIGLESIDAVLISGEIEDEFQVEVEPSMMFELQTFGEVVAAVTALLGQR